MIVGLTIFVSCACVFFSFKFQTIEPLTFLTTPVFAELAAATGFYYWKARTENKLKITLSIIEALGNRPQLTEEEVKVLEMLIDSIGGGG